MSSDTRLIRAKSWLNRPVDASSLVVFRVGFALLMAWEAYWYVRSGRIDIDWLIPEFHFKYFGFGWVEPLGHTGMYAVFLVLGIAAIGMLVGWKYRLCAFVVWLCFTYQFLLEQALYLNHFYAASLFALFLIFMPAHAAWSVDSMQGGRITRVASIPAWPVYLLRFQTGVIYFYAGVAKINRDWLNGDPIVSWMRARTDNLFVRVVFDLGLEIPVFAYGGMLIDLLLAPLLLWRRTRLPAFVIAVLFHLWNSALFTIGIFPAMMIVATTMFFEPDWPRRLVARVRRRELAPAPAAYSTSWQLRDVGIAIVALYATVQVLLPLRHHLYPGDVAWTEEGHRWAWRMMLREKTANAHFVLVDQGKVTDVDVDRYLTFWQRRTMSLRPDMMQQFAHFLADDHERKTGRRPQVYANSAVSLNFGKSALLLKENVDLAATPKSLAPADWINRSP